MDKQFFKELAKDSAKFVCSAGVGAVVSNAIKFTSPLTMSPVNRVLVMVGNVVLTQIIVNKGTSEYIDSVIEQFSNINKPKGVEPEPNSK